MTANENMRATIPGDIIFSNHQGVFNVFGIAITEGCDGVVPAEPISACDRGSRNG